MKAYQKKYKDVHYDRLAIWVKKGKRDIYKKAAAELGVSLSMLVRDGVEEFIRNHLSEDFIEKIETEKKS